MRKTLAALAIVAGCAVLLPSTAAASPIVIGGSTTFAYSGFGATSEDTCSVCTALATFTLVDSNTLRIELENTSTFAAGDADGGNIITLLAVQTSPNIEFMAGTANFFGTANWGVRSTGVGQWTFKVDTPGANAALQSGQSLMVEFDLQTPITSLAIDLSQVHWQQTGLGNEDSDRGPGVPTPEPGSMLLLGSGLLFVARSVRRRLQA